MARSKCFPPEENAGGPSVHLVDCRETPVDADKSCQVAVPGCVMGNNSTYVTSYRSYFPLVFNKGVNIFNSWSNTSRLSTARIITKQKKAENGIKHNHSSLKYI